MPRLGDSVEYIVWSCMFVFFLCLLPPWRNKVYIIYVGARFSYAVWQSITRLSWLGCPFHHRCFHSVFFQESCKSFSFSLVDSVGACMYLKVDKVKFNWDKLIIIIIVRMWNCHRSYRLVAIVIPRESKMFLLPTRTENSLAYVIPAWNCGYHLRSFFPTTVRATYNLLFNL